MKSAKNDDSGDCILCVPPKVFDGYNDCKCENGTDCGAACCGDGETCINGSSCCPTARVCENEMFAICCPEGDTCVGNSCCDTDKVCDVDGTLTCCGSSETCVANMCCQSTQVCGSGDTVSCCSDTQECGTKGTCCPKIDPASCANGTTTDDNGCTVCKENMSCTGSGECAGEGTRCCFGSCIPFPTYAEMEANQSGAECVIFSNNNKIGWVWSKDREPLNTCKPIFHCSSGKSKSCIIYASTDPDDWRVACSVCTDQSCSDPRAGCGETCHEYPG